MIGAIKLQRIVAGGSSRTSRRVLILLPFDMSVRNFITSPVAAHLAADPSLDVMMVSREGKDRDRLEAIPGRPIRWEPIVRPFRLLRTPGMPPLRRARILFADTRLAVGHYWFLSLVYRFNVMRGFRGFLDRIRQSRPLRRLAFKEGLPLRRWLGFPFAASASLFAVLRAIYFSRWQRHVLVEELFDSFRPDVLVITHLQISALTPYVLAARARGIPILGVNGSWDQPTTKGPMLPGISHVLAQSRQVVDDLSAHHDYPRQRMEVVGWPQMDVYADQHAAVPRDEFLAKLGLAPDARYVLVAAYTDRLGQHEPEMCRTISEAIARSELGPGAVLYIRCHPLDAHWQSRLGALHQPPNVIVEPPDLGALDHLTNLIRHAEVVIASASTINLDAAALDTPSIAIAFEEEDLPFYDRAARRYDMEHVAAVMACGGIRKVRTVQELMAAVRGYFADRTIDGAGRAALRDQHLAPLDGQASHRIAVAIARFAHTHAGTESTHTR